ncbi:MAG: hypothetical protein AUK43_05145 [Oscillatoriales cyanobacterium CG2_30_40_61]|nr:MAG: hypothetical protein AUK43_05145 [Oscillatoriales cyanobacterium CG2_30_40_61]
MTQALPKLVNFEEFVEWLPENSAVRYELHNRDIVEMAQPVGEHEEQDLRTQPKKPGFFTKILRCDPHIL